MHFRKALSPDFLGADDFVNREMEPIEKRLTIKSVVMKTPPAGKNDRLCVYFVEDPRGAFFSNSQVKKIAHDLRRADTDLWIGSVLTITSGEVKSPRGGMTTGMKVVSAKFEAPKAATNVQP